MILASHGIIGSSIGQVDADAVAFFGRVSAATGILSDSEKSAVNQFVLDLKANSLWTPMKAIYPIVGGGAGTTAQRSAACAQNLKSSSFAGTFNGTWSYSSNGVKGDGSSGEFLSNFALNNFASRLSVAFGLYSRTNIGASGAGMTAGAAVEFYTAYSGGNQQYSYLFESKNDNTIIVGYAGLNSHSRTSSSQKFMQKKTSVTSFTSDVNTTDLSSTIVKFSRTGQGFDPNQYALYYISDGLSDTQLLSLNTIVNTYQTALNRAV